MCSGRTIHWLLLTLSLVFVLGLGAQTTGTLSGTITAVAGVGPPNAAITVTPVNGGAAQRVVANAEGAFAITGLPPRAYRVEVESAGFKRASVQNIDLETNNSAQIRVQLQQGDT